MTREEEILRQAFIEAKANKLAYSMEAIKEGFIKGAQYADQHPQYFRGQTDEMMERESLFCDAWFKEHKGERPTYADAIAWADSHPNGSVIHWQTGEPTEEGDYITVRKNPTGDTYVAYNVWHLGRWFAEACDYSVIIAWCKLSDIKPYKED